MLTLYIVLVLADSDKVVVRKELTEMMKLQSCYHVSVSENTLCIKLSYDACFYFNFCNRRGIKAQNRIKPS